MDFFKDILPYFYGAVAALCFYLTVYLVFSFLAIDVFHIFLKENKIINLVILIIIIFLYSLINWKEVLRFKFLAWAGLVLFVILTFLNQKIINEERRKVKIFFVRPRWGIQGSTVIVKGKNFGIPIEEGEIYLDGQLNTQVQKWSDNEIVLIQPVPRNFGEREVYVVTKKGKKSNVYYFDIKNPTPILSPIAGNEKRSDY